MKVMSLTDAPHLIHTMHSLASWKVYAFDEAHPALAEQHYLRTMEQNRMLEMERMDAAKEREAERQELTA